MMLGMTRRVTSPRVGRTVRPSEKCATKGYSHFRKVFDFISEFTTALVQIQGIGKSSLTAKIQTLFCCIKRLTNRENVPSIFMTHDDSVFFL